MSTKSMEKLGPRGLINRIEYVRLIQQALHKLGYPEVALQLERESGIQMQPSHATAFQTAVLEGNWNGALALLPQLSSHDDTTKGATFLILQQKYMEALEVLDYETALRCLRSELSPLKVNEKQLHYLAGLLLCPVSGEAGSRSAWLGGGKAQRGQVLAQLQARLPPSLIIPDGRLEQLVEQALSLQVSRCQYHNAVDVQLSLFSDYHAGIESLPTQLVQVLEHHEDEVWHVAFSHDGSMLASASKDRTAMVFQVSPRGVVGGEPLRLRHPLPVSFLSWSPNDEYLLTASDDCLRLWHTRSGETLHAFNVQREVKAAAWFPDSHSFACGGVDKTLHVFDVEGVELQRLRRPHCIIDLAVSPDGRLLLEANNQRQVHIIRLSDWREGVIQEPRSGPAITSIALSPDGTALLVSLNAHTLHLWHIGAAVAAAAISAVDAPAGPQPHALPLGKGGDASTAEEPFPVPDKPMMEYLVNDGRTGRFILSSGFGGSEGSFVVHGSEDCMVYMWHRDSGELLLKLEGHAGTVNAVAWNPANPYLLASASDDRTVRVWVSAAALRAADAAAPAHTRNGVARHQAPPTNGHMPHVL